MLKVSKALLLAPALLATGAIADSGQTLDIRQHEAPAVCGSHAPQIQVDVAGVRAGGILTVELYAPSVHDFLRKASRLHRIRVPATDGTQTVCFDINAAGTYALAAYNDLNGDRDLARKWNRLPAEPFALSNNKPLGFGMPRFKDAAFEAGDGSTLIQIELQE
ncbi:DUF2141 domain-containing protein [Hyphomonas johnsonii]|uniref:DUF2141 domain-containing protein n=1 Tax=Hyphomonas johnsonii MHS-2 TaxID=1280950 RepID=A0A059FBM1_9PROT|nr:DUF2141 domain-containing protein [Hyphomonas johnsonii]KCZ87938.1 hypothetical protein HJO_16180 [Hyphomonas johnsonii MHS-2]